MLPRKSYALLLLFFLDPAAANDLEKEVGDGFELKIMGCSVEIPSGYLVQPTKDGDVQLSHMVDPREFPGIVFSVQRTWKEAAVSENWKIQSESQIGDLDHLMVELLFEGGSVDWTWAVIASDESFFATFTRFKTDYVDQFLECKVDS